MGTRGDTIRSTCYILPRPLLLICVRSIELTSLNLPDRQLWLGKIPISLIAEMSEPVPNRRCFSTHVGASFTVSRIDSFTFANLSVSCTSTSLVPPTTSPFNIFEPIIAPAPPLPKVLAFWPSVATQDIGFSRSPAGPMHTHEAFFILELPINASWLGAVNIPQYSLAS